MERLLYNQISDYFTKKQLLSKQQFGFRPLHSTTTTLLDCTNEWYVNMDHGLYNLVVLLDLKKAFNTVNHGILLHKLQLYGFETRALDFMRDYLTNRTQTQDEKSYLHSHSHPVPKCKCRECITFAIVQIHVQMFQAMPFKRYPLTNPSIFHYT